MPYNTLFVTLRRGLAGKKAVYLATLKSLGLRKPRQVVEVQNNSASRGQIEKVRATTGMMPKSHDTRRLRNHACCFLSPPRPRVYTRLHQTEPPPAAAAAPTPPLFFFA